MLMSSAAHKRNRHNSNRRADEATSGSLLGRENIDIDLTRRAHFNHDFDRATANPTVLDISLLPSTARVDVYINLFAAVRTDDSSMRVEAHPSYHPPRQTGVAVVLATARLSTSRGPKNSLAKGVSTSCEDTTRGQHVRMRIDPSMYSIQRLEAGTLGRDCQHSWVNHPWIWDQAGEGLWAGI